MKCHCNEIEQLRVENDALREQLFLTDMERKYQSERRERAETKLAKIEELHVRVGLPEHHRTPEALGIAPDRCSSCWGDGNYELWPCPTMRALGHE